MERSRRWRRAAQKQHLKASDDESETFSASSDSSTDDGESPPSSGAGVNLFKEIAQSTSSPGSHGPSSSSSRASARKPKVLASELSSLLHEATTALRGRSVSSSASPSEVQLTGIRKRLHLLSLDLLQLQLAQMSSGAVPAAVASTKELCLMAERMQRTLADAAQCCGLAKQDTAHETSQKFAFCSTSISARFPQDAQVCISL